MAGGAQRVWQACQSRDLEEDGEGGGLQGQEDLAEYERAFQVMVVVFVMVMMVARETFFLGFDDHDVILKQKM